MKEIVARITRSGRIALPVEVRRVLGVGPRDTLRFDIDRGQVRLVPVRATLRSLVGSVAPPTRTEDFKRISRQVRDERTASSVAG